MRLNKDVKRGKKLQLFKGSFADLRHIWHQSRFHGRISIELHFFFDGMRRETCEKNSVFNFILGKGYRRCRRWIYGVSSHLTASRLAPVKITAVANTSAGKVPSLSDVRFSSAVTFPSRRLDPSVSLRASVLSHDAAASASSRLVTRLKTSPHHEV